MVVVLEDISEEVQVRAALEANQRFRELFIGVLGHDLRDPLSAISSGTQLLIHKGGLDEGQLRILERIGNSVRRMARMTDEAVDFARSRLGGGFTLKRTPTDLEQIVRAAAADLKTSHPNRDITLSFDGLLTGEWDADRLARVVWNVLGNAIVHGDPTLPVRVSAFAERSSVSTRGTQRRSPDPADLLPVLFDPFRRAEANHVRHGLGLGLYIAQADRARARRHAHGRFVERRGHRIRRAAAACDPLSASM